LYEFGCDHHAMSGAVTVSSSFITEVQGIQDFISAQGKFTTIDSLLTSQCDSLVHRIGAVHKMDMQTATALTQLIQNGPWTPPQKDMLAGALQARLTSEGSSTDPRARRKNQVVMDFSKYLSESDVEALQDSSQSSTPKF
jgi:hypothetical protein